MSARWNEKRRTELRRLLCQGLTDPEIADRLGVTLRAAIGKRQRLGITANPLRRGGVLIARTLPALLDRRLM